MPQLDKVTFYHQIVVVSFCFFILHCALSLIILPEFFSNVFTRRLFLNLSKDDLQDLFLQMSKNLLATQYILDQVAGIHEIFQKLVYLQINTIIPELPFVKEVVNANDLLFKGELYLAAADFHAIKTLF